jgi:hypothetical protein
MSKKLLTRNDCREIGLDYSNTQFQRWEKDKYLTAIKPTGRPSARVHYDKDEVDKLLGTRPPNT